MKKRNLMTLLIVAAMAGTMLIGCGGSDGDVDADINVENQQDDVVADDSNESGVDTTVADTEEAVTEEIGTEEIESTETAEVVDDGMFYGLPITPSGEEVIKSWHIPFDPETESGGVVFELPVIAEVTTNVTEDGMYEKTVTYTIKSDGTLTGDWQVFVFDYNTGENLLHDDSEHSAYASETTQLEDGTQVWSATLVSPQETDSVFVWGQRVGELHDTTVVDDSVPFTLEDYPEVFGLGLTSEFAFLLTRN